MRYHLICQKIVILMPILVKKDVIISSRSTAKILFFVVRLLRASPSISTPEETFRQMKAAYYGAVSQMDWQIGLILETLKEKGLKENTIVVFVSDHGEFLGDYGILAKASFLLDCMLHVPFLICVPNKQNNVTFDELMESVDLFPTL